MIAAAAPARRRAGSGVSWIVGALLALAGSIAPFAVAAACSDFAAAPSTRWAVTTENGVSWLVTPCGERFFSLGVNVLDGGNGEHAKAGSAYTGYRWQAFAPTLAAWADDTRSRLFAWGFNSAGAWSLAPQQLRLPTVVNLELGRLARFHWFDPFAPETEARMTALARKSWWRPTAIRPIGSAISRTTRSGGGPGRSSSGIRKSRPIRRQNNAGSSFLRRRYKDDWPKFLADFLPPRGVDSWDSLLAATEVTHMRPGGAGIHAVREWTGIVAERYYALAEKAIRAADPEALYFGDRLPIYYDPAAVKAMARHVDAIATNYNVDSADGWVADYFFDGLRKLSGGKPVLVSEWFFAAAQNRTGNRNNGHLMTVATQAERAAGAAAATAQFRPGLAGDRRPLVPVLRSSEGRAERRRGLRFRTGRHRQPALRAIDRRTRRRQPARRGASCPGERSAAFAGRPDVRGAARRDRHRRPLARRLAETGEPPAAL